MQGYAGFKLSIYPGSVESKHTELFVAIHNGPVRIKRPLRKVSIARRVCKVVARVVLCIEYHKKGSN